jgi:hypothetical protein
MQVVAAVVVGGSILLPCALAIYLGLPWQIVAVGALIGGGPAMLMLALSSRDRAILLEQLKRERNRSRTRVIVAGSVALAVIALHLGCPYAWSVATVLVGVAAPLALAVHRFVRLRSRSE